MFFCLLRALRLPFGLPSGREHFMVARAMPSAAKVIKTAEGQ